MNSTTWRKIPGFSGYSVSKSGLVRNNRTGRILSPKDFNHSSGRFSLYNRYRKVSISLERILQLASMTTN